MLLRRRGETHKQFINRLQKHSDEMLYKLKDRERRIEDLVKSTNTVPWDLYKELQSKYENLRAKLIEYNLYTGE